MLVHVLVEVGLGLELPLQLLGPHEAEAALLGAVDLVGHVGMRRCFSEGKRRVFRIKYIVPRRRYSLWFRLSR